MNSNHSTASGVLRTVLDHEIAAALDRLGFGSLEALRAEEERYPWVEEHSGLYRRFPCGIARRVRAIELVVYLVQDGEITCLPWLDKGIAELRKVLRTAAREVPERIARQLERERERETMPARPPGPSMWRHEITLIGKAAA